VLKKYQLTKTACLLALSIGMTQNAWADSQLDALCSQTAMSSNYGANNTQAQQYCAAGKAAENAASADGDVWIIYAAAATVCTSACAASMAGTNPYAKPLELACTGSSVGAAGIDAVQTGNYMTALSSIVLTAGIPAYNMLEKGESLTNAVTGGPTVGSALNSLTGGGGTPAAGAAASKGGLSQANLAACVAAASNAFSAYSKHSDENSSQATVQQTVQQLQALESTTGATSNAIAMSANTASGGGTTLTGASSGGTNNAISSGATTAAGASPATTSSCSGSNSSDGAQCAATASATPIMPAALASALQGVTGLTPAQFAAQAAQAGPGAAIASGLGQGAGAFAHSLDQLASSGQMQTEGGYYAKGGSGPSGADPLASMMGNLLEQYGQKKKADEKAPGVTTVEFGQRAPASANPENDRNVSLFSRVAGRYASLAPELLGMTDTQAALPALPFSAPK
jgi:hypothetical protein